MSLIKQLWIAIIALLLLSFIGSLAISITTSRDYIEQEVRIKNADNATALALSMSQLDKDLVTLELLIAAQFDTGYYRRITLRNTDDSVLIERSAEEYSGDVPAWFRQLIDLMCPTAPRRFKMAGDSTVRWSLRANTVLPTPLYGAACWNSLPGFYLPE